MENKKLDIHLKFNNWKEFFDLNISFESKLDAVYHLLINQDMTFSDFNDYIVALLQEHKTKK